MAENAVQGPPDLPPGHYYYPSRANPKGIRIYVRDKTGEKLQQCFGFQRHGGMLQTINHAKVEREKWMLKIWGSTELPADQGHSKPRATAGDKPPEEVGVRLFTETRNGREYQHWSAEWRVTDANGKRRRRRKQFSVARHGFEQAKQLAIEERAKRVANWE